MELQIEAEAPSVAVTVEWEYAEDDIDIRDQISLEYVLESWGGRWWL